MNVDAISQDVRHCKIENIGIEITGEDSPSVIDDVNRYLNVFAASDGKCVKCGSVLGGLIGSFVWGITHGEGFCGGGFDNRCGWPCRGKHYIKDSEGKEIFTRPLPFILSYHPDFVETNGGV